MTLPVVCAPMTAVTGPELVAEACKAGIMAVLPRRNAGPLETFERWLADIRTTIDTHRAAHPEAVIGPLAVNLTSRRAVSEIGPDLDACARYGVDVIVNAMGDPTELVHAVHAWGGKVMHDVTTIRFAQKAVEAGVDGLTCVVAGGGGHAGQLNPLVFVPRVRAMFDGVICLAGGISTGEAVRAAEVLGADLAYLGTRFIATREARVPGAYRELIVAASATDLIYTSDISGLPANWLRASLVSAGLDPDRLPRAAGRGDTRHLPAGVRPWHDLWSAGQGVELIDDIPTVAELVDRLRAEYAAACTIPAHA